MTFWTLLATIIAPIISMAVTVAAARIAWVAVQIPRKETESKNHLDQAVLSLERAYEALTDGGTHIKPVRPDRLNWLTAARHIETFKSLKALIHAPSHRLRCADHEEYWRHRFYIAVDMRNIHNVSYYAPDPVNGPDGLDPVSLIVVYGFATWSHDRPDPISNADLFRIMRETDPRPGNIGLKAYLEQFPKYASMPGQPVEGS